MDVVEQGVASGGEVPLVRVPDAELVHVQSTWAWVKH